MFEPTAMLAILLSPSGNPVETQFANLQLSLTWLFRCFLCWLSGFSVVLFRRA
jgi:hypothetical protein